jgi:hypothetical protein
MGIKLLLILFAILAFLSFSLLQVYAGFIGIDFYFGKTWAIAAIILAMLFRFTLPITIGALFCATDVWGWHWFVALLFVSPGLIFTIPGLFLSIIARIKKLLIREKRSPDQVIIEHDS